jgi:branched-chain amino acid transport system substrate-binding protein
MSEIFKERAVAPKRLVLMYANDLFGQTQARFFQAAHKAAAPGFDIVEVIPWPEPPSDLSTEVSRLKAARPDVIAPITRPASALLLLQELAKQRVDAMGVISPGAPGLYEAPQIAQLKELIEHVMDNVPWPNVRDPRTRQVAEAYAARSGGQTFDTNSGYSHDGLVILADVLERAGSTQPEAVVDAMKKTSFTGGLMVAAGPVTFNEIGDNPNASSAMIQVLGQKPRLVWPKAVAEQPPVFPSPKR